MRTTAPAPPRTTTSGTTAALNVLTTDLGDTLTTDTGDPLITGYVLERTGNLTTSGTPNDRSTTA